MLSLYLTLLDSEYEKNEFEQLYIKYRFQMYNTAFGILNNREDAEDAVQEAFLIIAKKFRQFTEKNDPKIGTLFIIIVRDISIDIYRKNKKRPRYAEPSKNDKTDVETAFFERYESEAIKKAIKELPERYRDTIFLYYIEQLSPKNIASLLGETTSAVYKRIQRAKFMLRSSLEKGDYYA